MNPDIEKTLKELRPAKPSDELDRRMAQLFVSAAHSVQPALWRRPIPLWLCAAACLLFGTLGFVIQAHQGLAPSPLEAPAQVVHIIYSDHAATHAFLDWTQDREPFWEPGAKRTVYITPPGGETPL